jgi:hypothetical protein
VTPLHCTRCGLAREIDDNFCRRCGHQFTANLPVVQTSNFLPARTRAIPPSLVGSVAVLAVGTGLEWLARKLAKTAAISAGRALIGQAEAPVARRKAPDDVTVDEMLYVRKVQLRR